MNCVGLGGDDDVEIIEDDDTDEENLDNKAEADKAMMEDANADLENNNDTADTEQ